MAPLANLRRLASSAIPPVVRRTCAAFSALAVMIGLVYRNCPDRRAVRPSWVTWGSATGAVLWILGTLALSWCVQDFGSYDPVYGNLGAAVGFLSWIWISLMILLGRAELDREIERERERISAGSL